MKAKVCRKDAFLVSENGLVTVEWVALASTIVAGAMLIGYIVHSNLHEPANQIGNSIVSTSSEKMSGF
jgi:hypothetical protein